MDIAAFLQANGLWQGPLTTRALKGGYLNEVLAVTTGDAAYVLKRFAPAVSGTLFPNLPGDEARALQVLAGLQVAPRLVGYWPDQALMIYEYATGAPWDRGTAAIARVLARKETADPAGFRRVPTDPAAILAEAEALFALCRNPPLHRRPVLRDVPPLGRLSLIHTDLGPGNLIGAGQDFRIIDWQCPAAGDPCEDCYSFLSPAFQILSQHAPLTAPEVAEFWTALGREDLGRDDLCARHSALKPYFAWRMAAYCLWRSQTRTEPDIRARYARAYRAELDHMRQEDAG